MASNGSNGHKQSFQPRMLINGELVGASDGKTFPLYNPATRELVTNVPEATVQDTDRAVAAAKAAFPAWSALHPSERGARLRALADLVEAHQAELASLEAQAMGKPVSYFLDGPAAVSDLRHYAEAWAHIQGSSSLNTPGHVAITLRQPVGVVAAIIPWNFPLVFFAGKAAPALIAGNTVVVKTSEKAPLAAARVAQLAVEKGVFPPGVLNVVHGHGVPCGEVLSKHMDVRVLSFTGSGRTGRAIQVAAAQSNLKKVVLELGGKSPALVFADADVEKAVADTSDSISFNAGQVCMANSRVYVHASIREQFVRAFVARFGGLQTGDPLDEATTQGPQADEGQYKSVLAFIEDGVKAGGTLSLGGKGALEQKQGYFIEPTVFVDSPEQSRIMKEEVFGPVVNINTFETEEEAIKAANDSEYGLYASVYTRDLDRALRVATALESGYVGVNTTSPNVVPDTPFGGYKSSGQGREGWLHSLDNFLETKTVLVKLS